MVLRLASPAVMGGYPFRWIHRLAGIRLLEPGYRVYRRPRLLDFTAIEVGSWPRDIPPTEYPPVSGGCSF